MRSGTQVTAVSQTEFSGIESNAALFPSTAPSSARKEPKAAPYDNLDPSPAQHIDNYEV